jgi:hypothetical protein
MNDVVNRQVGAEPRWLARPEIWIALAVFLGGAYFCGSGSWNQNARLDAIFTFVEPGPHRYTFRLDPFLPWPNRSINTGDWALVGTHYYANKAPGTILLGVLAYWPAYLLETSLGASWETPAVAILNAYWINLCVSVMPLAVASLLWYRLLARRVSAARAAALTLLTFFGSALFPYSTQLWGHTTSAAFLMMAWWAFDAAPVSPSRPWDLVAGAGAGIAVLSDFLAFPAVLLLCGSAALRRPQRLPWLCLGGAVPLAILLAYQAYCFGSPWVLPTEHTRPEFIDTNRALGLFGAVDAHALFELTFGPQRGIFFQMPLFIAALVGFAFWGRRDPRGLALWANLGAFALTLVLIASFNGWHGGATVCARYLVVVLPLLARGLAELPSGPVAGAALGLLAMLSLVNMLAVASVGPLAPDALDNPLRDFIYPQWLAGQLHPYPLPIRLHALHPTFAQWAHLTVWNFGDVLGLGGLFRLVPLVVLAGAASVAAFWAARRKDLKHADETPEVSRSLA